MHSRKSRFSRSLKRKRFVPTSAKRSEAEKDAKNRETLRTGGNKKQSGSGDDEDSSSGDEVKESELFSDGESGDDKDGGDGPPGYSLSIKKISSAKDKIRNPHLSEENVIPRLGTSSVMNGTTGQGKSTLLTNLISSDRFFGGRDPETGEKVFDCKFLVSPTAEGDDVQKKLGVKKKNTFTDLDEAPEMLKVIMDAQKKKVLDQGSDKAPQYLLVYDDVISNPKFMRADEFTKSFIASRHYNLTTFVCSQSWTSVPRKCRLQAKNIFFFQSPLSEVELLCQEYCPPNMTKKQFFKMVDYCTGEPYSFMYINKSVPMEQRFRKRLGEVINLKFFQGLDITRENELKSNSAGGDQANSLQSMSVAAEAGPGHEEGGDQQQH